MNTIKRPFLRYVMLILTIICFSLTSSNAHAELFMDGGTLPKGDLGASLQIGVDDPGVLLWGVRVDYGILDRWQLGGFATSLIFLNTIGLANKFNIVSTGDKSFTLGIDLLASYTIGTVIIANLQRFNLNPMLVTGFRFGDEKNTGIYFKAGTTSMYVTDADTFLGGYWNEDGQPSDAENRWEHAIKGGMGVQHSFSERFNMYLEGGVLANIKDPSTNNLTYFVVLGFQFL